MEPIINSDDDNGETKVQIKPKPESTRHNEIGLRITRVALTVSDSYILTAKS